MTSLPGDDPIPVIFIPEVRDYRRINGELIALLNRGHDRIQLKGAEGQRLLVSGLAGSWLASVEVFGNTGPEFAANLTAPHLKIIAHGSTLDGAGRGLQAGLILIDGDVGDAVGYAQAGGHLVVTGNAGHRAGLAQAGGALTVLGSSGRLAGDRQRGGCFFLGMSGVGPFAGHGQTGGQRVAWSDPLGSVAGSVWQTVVEAVQPWLDPTGLVRP